VLFLAPPALQELTFPSSCLFCVLQVIHFRTTYITNTFLLSTNLCTMVGHSLCRESEKRKKESWEDRVQVSQWRLGHVTCDGCVGHCYLCVLVCMGVTVVPPLVRIILFVLVVLFVCWTTSRDSVKSNI